MSYATRLNQAINAIKGMNQSRLARAIGVKPQAIQYLCAGKAIGSKYTAAIASVLNVDSEWLESGQSKRYENQPDLETFNVKEENEPVYGYHDGIEKELITLFRQLNDENKSYILGSCVMYIDKQEERKYSHS